MTPPDPIREHCLYLDHAAACPLPRPVAEAMRQRIADQERTGFDNYQEWRNHHLTCRHLGSQLIGCRPEDISIVRSTSEGLSMVAEGWLEKADQVLVGERSSRPTSPRGFTSRARASRVRYPQVDGRVDPNRS
jgi:selenocysteine lyase/cysteine desulfurase